MTNNSIQFTQNAYRIRLLFCSVFRESQWPFVKLKTVKIRFSNAQLTLLGTTCRKSGGIPLHGVVYSRNRTFNYTLSGCFE